MRDDLREARIAIERVLYPSTGTVHAFRAVVDAASTIAVGSACALALTLGPAPMNTIAASSAATSTIEQLETDPAEAVRSTGTTGPATPAPSPAGAPETPPHASADPDGPPSDSPPPVEVPVSSPAPILPGPKIPPIVMEPDGIAGTALDIVEAARIAAGLSGFVGEAACTAPTPYRTVHVTPVGVLPDGLAKQSLAPDPAHAAVTATEGAIVSVTVYRCG